MLRSLSKLQAGFLLLKKRLHHWCFPVMFDKFKDNFFVEHLQAAASGSRNSGTRDVKMH